MSICTYINILIKKKKCETMYVCIVKMYPQRLYPYISVRNRQTECEIDKLIVVGVKCNVKRNSSRVVGLSFRS